MHLELSSPPTPPVVVDTLAALGVALRRQRIAHGYTQAEIAARAGVSARLWSEVERGARLNVAADTLLRMLQLSGLDLLVQSRRPLPRAVPPQQRRVR
ncbi:MAG: helix-turn-helix domain-containing protein [Gemmatimonadales bacterium]|nr:helix-turn-helix domain-containing protein [Gemmatimonadales bacterium]MDZ4388382.1 helix-turn-helix domain-containing protein [Gemmatimonadales bacterium]